LKSANDSPERDPQEVKFFIFDDANEQWLEIFSSSGV